MFYLKHRAIIQCDWVDENNDKGCISTEFFERPAEQYSLEDFNNLAKDHFIRKGWRFFDGFLCPYCHDRVKERKIPYADE